ncbi:hypothetical protein HD806DRAFT_295911 [Xylariaceae sp. AK1471]|nr:hypothetical protein HD806DRAFT_295911 [Xylariaceae sp. AK1471]
MPAQQVHPQFPSIAGAQLGNFDYVFYHAIEDTTLWVLRINNNQPQIHTRRQVLDSSSDVIFENSPGSRPLAASTWQTENEVHLYYVGSNNRLREIYTKDQGATWKTGKVNSLDAEVPDGSTLCATGSPSPAVYIADRSQYILEARYDNASDEYNAFEHNA